MVVIPLDQHPPKAVLTNTSPGIIFIHGLSGSPSGTWAKMAKCFSADETFQLFAIDFYAYPTKLIRLPFTAPVPGLRSIADGLTTYLDEEHGMRSSLTLVAHSLGGLVARQMIVSEMRAGRECRIEKLALLDTPNSGSMLASIGNLISFPHRQLKRLARDDEALRSLNADWEQLKVEEQIAVHYIVGGCDRAVPHDSAVPSFNSSLRKSLIINATHRSIVAPDDQSDIRYKVLRRFILDKAVTSTHKPPIPRDPQSRKADPLFDAYTPIDASFYIERAIDQIVRESLGFGSIWLVGTSGVGKTACLRRAVYQSGWELKHINLGGYQVQTAMEMFLAMTQEVAAVAGLEEILAPDSDIGQCCAYLKVALRSFPEDQTIATVVEELPLSPGELVLFIEQVRILLELIAIDKILSGRAVFAFSSLDKPTALSAKTQEKVQCLNMGEWSFQETYRLVDLLSTTLRPSLTDGERLEIVTASGGSPRFIKRLFRTWRSKMDRQSSLSELLQRCRLEEV